MHKCINNSVGNVYHLEQLVDNFFPYSQKQLGFDKPVTVVFQSDKGNSSKMLGKTAHYDPNNYQVVLYVDGRHPKDVMRSLSHELVHHAQNCRGDFTGDIATEEGYAQKNPHLRKMEREAYTKGNLIFRDYEDLIKTGKKDVDIDFTKSGDPKMSLKEWKNNERTRLLMEKWGYRQKGAPEQELFTEGWGYRDEDELESPVHPNGAEGLEENDEIEEGEAKWKTMADAPEDPTDAPTATALQQKRTKKRGEWGKKVRGKSDIRDKRDKPVTAGSKNVMTMGEAGPDPDILRRGEKYRKTGGTEAGSEEERLDWEKDPSMHADPESLGMKKMRYPKWGDPASRKYFSQSMGDALATGDLDPNYEKDLATWKAEKRRKYAAQFKEGEELEEASWDVSDKELGLHRPIDPKRSREEYEEDPAMMADPKTLGMKPMRKPKWGPPGAGGKGGEPAGAYEKDLAAWRAEKKKRYAGQFKEGKISVKEAKEITRRIIERIKKESN